MSRLNRLRTLGGLRGRALSGSVDTPASTPQVELTTEDSTPIVLEDGATYITTEAA